MNRIRDRDDQDLIHFDRRNYAPKCIIRFTHIDMRVDEKGRNDKISDLMGVGMKRVITNEDR